jgi:hypothetical protein
MELVLRAYDHAEILRAESMPVERLWAVLERGGLRDRAKVRVGLEVEPDLWARETVVSRLEALMQEGYGDESLARLRGATPVELAQLRRRHWPPIDHEEAVALREDLVRYLTYGLWQAPEEAVARALAVLTEQPDATFLLSNPDVTAGLRAVLDTIDDDRRFAEQFGAAVARALTAQGKPQDAGAVRDELQRLQILLGPAARLLRAAHDVGLRVIAYQDEPGGMGLNAFLAGDLEAGAPPAAERHADDAAPQGRNGTTPRDDRG